MDTTYCSYPGCLQVLEPQYTPICDTVIPYAVCQTCKIAICSKHIPNVPLPQHERDIDSFRLELKDDGFYFNTETTGERGIVEEDEEPHLKANGTCPQCKAHSEFVLYLWNRNRIKSCTRCTEFYQETDADGCVIHPGEHELPQDKTNKQVYGMNFIDMGGMMHAYYVHPQLYPGRWTCCGTLCYHDHPSCPHYDHSRLTRVETFPKRVEEEPNYLGCVNADHTLTKFETPPTVYLKFNKNIATKNHIQKELVDLDWRKEVNWNVGAPDHYPSGVACPENVTSLGTDFYDEEIVKF
jgi:Zn ribbon nucleic-acid-binding protein